MKKQRGLYQSKVNSSLACIQRPGNWAHNCKITYCFVIYSKYFHFLSADKKSSLVGLCAVNSDKSATKSGLVGRYLTVLDLKTSCRACRLVCGGPRQFVEARAYLNQWGIVMRVTWTSLFSNMAEIDSARRLNAGKSASVLTCLHKSEECEISLEKKRCT